MALTERQKMVCAIALWADNYNQDQIAKALDIDRDESVRLTSEGASAMSRGTLGYMKQTLNSEGKAFARNDDE